MQESTSLVDRLQEAGIRRPLVSPSLPRFAPVVGKLMTVLADPGVNFREVADLMKTDAALSSDVLRLANSALFSKRAEIRSILHAVAMIGLPTVRILVYTSSLWKATSGATGELVRMCWRHNLACALLSEHLSRGRVSFAHGYTAGLLHGVGQLAFVGRYPDEYARILYFAVRHGLPLRECEQAVFGIDHCRLGSRILLDWGLPRELADAAGYHEQPEASRHPLTQLAHSSCRVASHIGFQLRAPGCEASPAPRRPLSEEALALTRDPSILDTIALKANAIESSLG